MKTLKETLKEMFIEKFTEMFIDKEKPCLYCEDGPSVIVGIFIEGPSPYISLQLDDNLVPKRKEKHQNVEKEQADI